MSLVKIFPRTQLINLAGLDPITKEPYNNQHLKIEQRTYFMIQSEIPKEILERAHDLALLLSEFKFKFVFGYF